MISSGTRLNTMSSCSWAILTELRFTKASSRGLKKDGAPTLRNHFKQTPKW